MNSPRARQLKALSDRFLGLGVLLFVAGAVLTLFPDLTLVYTGARVADPIVIGLLAGGTVSILIGRRELLAARHEERRFNAEYNLEAMELGELPDLLEEALDEEPEPEEPQAFVPFVGTVARLSAVIPISEPEVKVSEQVIEENQQQEVARTTASVLLPSPQP